ncbi:MAG: flagellin C [Rhizobiaceae bacterium]|nr:flagellin C [Rhizobiaceae bacterium]
MSSIMTNSAAMTALQTLKATNKQLDVTQGRISTGYRVAEASDNAAYWSIATTMRSDNKALSTVQDSLGLGAATVDVAYTAMDSAKDYIDEIKTKLVAATAPGVDKSKIQAEITELQSQLTSLATSASFSGSNWLSVDSSASGYSATQSIVGSFTRNADNSVTLGKIDIALGNISLFDSSATGAGLLDQGVALAEDGNVQDVAQDAGDGAGTEAVVAVFADASAGVTLSGNNEISFDLIRNGVTTSITINKATVDTALSSTDGVISNAANMALVLDQALTDAGIDTTNDVTVAANGNAVEITHATDAVTDTLQISNAASSNNGNDFSLATIDISSASATEIETFIEGVNNMLESVTSAASSLGAVKSRIDMQSDFVSNLMDAVDRGVSQLVDADMEEESTRLQALQVQQQLGIQALSIANGNSQSILSLFR